MKEDFGPLPQDIIDQDRENAILAKAEALPAGPWHVGFLDDEMFMNATVVQTRPFDLRQKSITTSDGDVHEYENRRPGRWAHDLSDEELESIIGCTLLQAGLQRIGEGTELWDEIAQFWADARTDVPWLVERCRETERKRLEQLTAVHQWWKDTIADSMSHHPEKAVTVYSDRVVALCDLLRSFGVKI